MFFANLIIVFQLRFFTRRRRISHLQSNISHQRYFTRSDGTNFTEKAFAILCKNTAYSFYNVWKPLACVFINITPVKYPADEGCEMFALRQTWNIAPLSQCEIKFVSPHAAGVFHICKAIFHIEDILLVPTERISLKKARISVLFSGAGDRTWTGTVSPPRDFKSLASADFATPAY